jgi:O-antigen ligase
LLGEVLLDSSSFQNIFLNLDLTGGYYQNINMYLGLLIVSCMYFKSVKKWQSFIFNFIAILSFLGMLLIGGRTAVVATTFVVFFYFINSFKNVYSTKKNLVKFIMFSSLSALLIIFFSHYIIVLVENSLTFRRFVALSGDEDPSHRIFLFSKAIELFLSDGSTFLFGAGINSFPIYIGIYDSGMYPHNIFLELLSEYGIFGFGLFMIPIIYVLCLRRKRIGSIYGSTNEEKFIFLIATFYWILYSFTGGLRSSWVLLFFNFLLLPSDNDTENVENGCAQL